MGAREQILLPTLDAWVNPATGVGGTRDKSAGFVFQSEHLGYQWRDFEFDELYEEDDMAARIVDEPTGDAMRRGWKLRTTAADAGVVGKVVDKCDRLSLNAKIIEARRWARLYGLSAIYVGADDGGKPRDPLFRENIQNIHFLHTFGRDELVPDTWQKDPFAPFFGEPITYRVRSATPGAAGHAPLVHRSRLILFQGVSTTRRKRIERNGAGASVLTRVLRVLAQFNGAFAQSLAQLADSHQNLYKLKGLSKLLESPGGQAVITERIKAIDEVRSSINAMAMDADHDSFETRSLSGLTGTADLLEKFLLRLAAAANRPITRLFGQSPAGMNATGESDENFWNATVESERTDELQPAIEELLRLIFAAKQGPTSGREPDVWSIEWPKLKELSEKEQAEIDNINMQTDTGYETLGVLKPSDIAKARFGESSSRPSLSHEAIAALEDFDNPPSPRAAGEETQDEEDTAVADLAGTMTEQKIERCSHGKPNRCRICGIEKLPAPTGTDPFTGEVVWGFSWRPIPQAKPAQASLALT